ncbi:hypothetical protein [Rosistilla oblonga]|uniref:hypothetical protein n=1 Tax=Rosistilla oblonga TaxID=2527990 RepID=UPI003A96F85C
MIVERFGVKLRVASTGVQISREALKNAAGETWGVNETWQLSGRLICDKNAANKSASLDPQILAIENLFSRSGGDLKLLHTNGARSSHEMLDSQVVGGVQVASPVSFGAYQNGEYHAFRTFTVALVGTKRLESYTTEFLDWKESLRFQGGGPVYGFVERNEGLPIKQRFQEFTPSYVTQSGRIVGMSKHPTIDDIPFIYPASDLLQDPDFQLETPVRVGKNQFFSYPVTYEFRFGSETKYDRRSPNEWRN